MPGAPIVLETVTKQYAQTAAIDGISLAIPPGAFFSLLGPSGSGKTTLLMIIAGFVAPDGGTVRLGARDLSGVPPEKRGFGMVFQGYALFPTMTVAENVAFPLRVRGVPRAERDARVRATLDLVRLTGLDDRLPRALSGGQQQRVALARALVFDPEILLLDEPLSALDKKLRLGLQVELRDLQQRVGKTFVCVTHDQEEALSMSDEIAIIHRGRLIQTGSPEVLFERPASHFVADFLGESNFITGHVTACTGEGLRYSSAGLSLMQARSAAPVGSDILVALRPTKIAVHDREPFGTPNRIEGRLKSWSYRGAEIQCRVATALGTLSVAVPTWQSPFQPAADQLVWLSWQPDAAVLVVDDRDSGGLGERPYRLSQGQSPLLREGGIHVDERQEGERQLARGARA